MYEAESVHANEFYMYKFRTKFCGMKGKCPSPATCFHAHSKIMKRRVPALNEEIGTYNYIPEPCPQWRRLKRCSFGENCPRSHGWLEVIYHPLVYKTKLCKSKRKNGICVEYGVYCAKAHHRFEVRNLVNIFGLDWKRHYDLSGRFGFRAEDTFSGCNERIKRYKYHKNRVGLAVIPNTHLPLDINLFACYLLEKQSSIQYRSRKHMQNIDFEAFYYSDVQFKHLDKYDLEFKSPSWNSSFASIWESVSYQLSQKLGNGVGRTTNIWEQECRTQSTESKTQKVSGMLNPAQKDYERLSWRDTDWLMLCGKGFSQSDEQVEMSVLNSEGSERCEFNYNRMPQNWFKSRCLKKASEVFANRIS